MSYQGGLDYMPVTTVDEVADYTDMQGQASAQNVAKFGGNWKQDPAKSLVVLWVGAVVLYWVFGFAFRRHLA